MPGHLVRRLHQASTASFAAEITTAGFDLTSVQPAALAMIGAIPGIDRAPLAKAIAFGRPITGGVIDRLEAKGFVRRETTRADRRLRNLDLEAAGKAILNDATPVVRREQDRLLDQLDDTERATFLLILSKMLGTFGEPGLLSPG